MLTKILIGLALLLIVIAGSLIVLNPLENLRRQRDERRIANLAEIKKTIDYYITKNAKVGAPLCRDCTLGKDVFAYRTIELSEGNLKVINERFVNSHGWIPVDLSINAELFTTPLKLLPVDPLEETYPVRQNLPLINNFFPKEEEDFVYTYTPGENGKYKLTAKMESEMGLGEAKSDGGKLADRYEVGELSLLP